MQNMTPIQQAYLRMLNYLGAPRGSREDILLAAQRFYQSFTGHRSLLHANRVRRQLMNGYLATSGVRKLMLGAGCSSRKGWLITDIAPQSSSVMYLDVTKPFPFDDASFEYIHAEHLIEHISWND